MIIGFSGKAGSGKDTAAKCWALCAYNKRAKYPFFPTNNVVESPSLMKAIADNSNYEIRRFADEVKLFAARLIGVEVEAFESQSFKKSNLPPEWNIQEEPLSVRDLLIGIGDGLRKTVHPDIWVNALFQHYRADDPQQPNWLIPDVRYPNEKERIEKLGGIVIRIENPLAIKIDSPSETALDDANFQHIIHNNPSYTSESYKELCNKIEQVYESISLRTA